MRPDPVTGLGGNAHNSAHHAWHLHEECPARRIRTREHAWIETFVAQIARFKHRLSLRLSIGRRTLLLDPGISRKRPLQMVNVERPSQPPVMTPECPPPPTFDESMWREDVGQVNEKSWREYLQEDGNLNVGRFRSGLALGLMRYFGGRNEREDKARRAGAGRGKESETEIDRAPGLLVSATGYTDFRRLIVSRVPRPNSPTGSILKVNIPFVDLFLNLTDEIRKLKAWPSHNWTPQSSPDPPVAQKRRSTLSG